MGFTAVLPVAAYTDLMQSHWSCRPPFNPSCSQSLPVHIGVVYMSLYQSFASWMQFCGHRLLVHSAPIYGSISLPVIAEWQKGNTDHFIIGEPDWLDTGLLAQGHSGQTDLWPLLRSSGVSHPEFIRTLLELSWMPYSKATWPWRTAYNRYWLEFVSFSWGWTNLPTLGSQGLQCKVKYWK